MRSVRALTLFAAAAAAGCAEAPRRPSIVLVVVDTLRADYLSSYGFEGPVSPALDALAAESVRFERCFAQAPWTVPSVATLVTSLHPSVHGLTDHEGRYWGRGDAELRAGVLPEEATTLAEALRAGGYRTAAFVANPWLTARYGFGQGFEVYDDAGAGNRAGAGRLLSRAREWVAEHEEDGAPFFLYLHLMDVHGPYDAPLEDSAALAGAPGLGPDRALDSSERARIPAYLRKSRFAEPGDSASLRGWRARYAAGVRTADRELGAFLGFLRERGALAETVVVVTSDHGEELHEHGGWDHGNNLYDHQLRVPLLVRLPEGSARTVSEVVGLVDLMPTALALADVARPPGLQGRDLSPLLRGAAGDPGAVAVATATKRSPGLFAVRGARFKLVVDTETGAQRLFDLEADPAEQADAGAAGTDARTDDEARALAAELAAHARRAAERGRLEGATAPVSDELAERLRTLGYVE